MLKCKQNNGQHFEHLLQRKLNILRYLKTGFEYLSLFCKKKEDSILNECFVLVKIIEELIECVCNWVVYNDDAFELDIC